MNRIITLIAAMVCVFSANAKKFQYNFHNTPISQALVTISHDNSDLNISFIYKELDNYKTSATIDTDEPYEALHQIIWYNPIGLVEKHGTYYIEALQHGKYVYSGRAISSNYEPVVAATVMLLTPKDSAIVTYGVTDDSGHFTIPCDRKNVIGKLTCVGYKPKTLKFQDLDIGDIIMDELPIELTTLNVESETAVSYSDRNVFIPTSRQRNTAQDGIDLLRRMAIPQIKIGIADNEVTTTSGLPVTIYINYVKASAEELEGMKTSDIRKVEYSYSPSDSRFMGDRNVINFITQTYEYGGYTKLMLSEKFFIGLSNNASAYSKFTYKKMTYDIYVGSRNFNNHHNGNSNQSSYLLNSGSDNQLWVNRMQTPDNSHLVQNIIPVTFRTTYSSKNFQTKNTLSFTLQDTPDNDVCGTLNFSPDMADDKSYNSKTSSKIQTSAYSGYFNFRLPDGYNLTLSPYASYSRNRQNSHYVTEATSILNDARENAAYLSMTAMGRKVFSDVHYIFIRCFGGRSDYKVDYVGNTSASDKIMESWGGGTLQYGYYTDNISADLMLGVRYQRNTTNKAIENECYPFVNANIGWSPNRKNSLNLSLSYAKEPMNANLKSPNVLQDNELLYYCGNPNLRYSPNIMVNLDYNWLPNSWLRISPFTHFFGIFDRYVPIYSEYNDGDAIIRHYENNGDHFRTLIGISATATFFDGNLQIQILPSQYFYKSTGYYHMTYRPFDISGSVLYYLGKFYVSAYYSSKYKTLWTNSGTIYKDKSQFQIGAGWSNSNLNVRLTASNPFRTSWISGTRELITPVYAEEQTYFSTKSHFNLNLSVTYTFSYGKKVSRGNEIGEQSGGASAILK